MKYNNCTCILNGIVIAGTKFGMDYFSVIKIFSRIKKLMIYKYINRRSNEEYVDISLMPEGKHMNIFSLRLWSDEL